MTIIFQNELTGEHSCIMLKMLNTASEESEDEDEKEENAGKQTWLPEYWKGQWNFIQMKTTTSQSRLKCGLVSRKVKRT